MNIRRLKKGEEKADRLRVSEPKEQHSSEFPAFSFFSLFCTHLGLSAGEASNQEMPTDIKDIKVPTKPCSNFRTKKGVA